MNDDHDCAVCWWAIEPDGTGWKHSTDRSELSDDDWMCSTPAPQPGPAMTAPEPVQSPDARVPCPACGDRGVLGFGCPRPRVHLRPERYADLTTPAQQPDTFPTTKYARVLPSNGGAADA